MVAARRFFDRNGTTGTASRVFLQPFLEGSLLLECCDEPLEIRRAVPLFEDPFLCFIRREVPSDDSRGLRELASVSSSVPAFATEYAVGEIARGAESKFVVVS